MPAKKKPKHVKVPFPVAAPVELTPVPPVTVQKPVLFDDADCEVVMTGNLWLGLGTAFVCLRAKDGRPIHELLHEGQQITIRCRREHQEGERP
jgi:hypothetical protein